MADETRVDSVCSICQSQYTSPRQLDCFHIFCTPCLEQLIEGKLEILCPLCRDQVSINENGVDMFKPYKYDVIENCEKSAEEIIVCQMCDDIEVYSMCKDCDQHMCRGCHEYHLKHKTFRTHKVEHIDKSARYTKDTGEKEVISCETHNTTCSLFCRSCNYIICEHCVKEAHSTHKISSVKSTADIMKHALGVRIEGLESKLPYIKRYIDLSKTEEAKYHKHIQGTSAEMKLAGSNLKSVFCKTIDMIIAQNLEKLERESKKDTKKIQNLIDESEREALSIQHLVKISKKVFEYAHESEIVQSSGALMRKLSSYENVHFPFLILNVPEYKPGTSNLTFIQECVGTISRQPEISLKLHLSVPCYGVPSYIVVKDFERIGTLSLDENASNIAAYSDSVYIFNFKSTSAWEDVLLSVDCRNLNGEQTWRSTPGLNENRKKFVGMTSDKIIMLCFDDWGGGDYIMINDIIHYKNGTVNANKTLVEISNISCNSACFTENGNILILNTYSNILHELQENGSEVKTITLSDETKWEETMQKTNIMYSLSKHILILASREIRCYDNKGDLKHRFCPETPVDFTSMCMDRHGNVFVAEASVNRICLFTWDGHFIKDILLPSDGIKEPKSLTVDTVGNLWVLMSDKLSFYSYL